MKKLFFFVLILSSTLKAQVHKVLDTTDYTIRQSLIKEVDQKNLSLLKKLKKTHKGTFRKELESSYNQLHKSFKKDINSKKLIFDKEFNDYTLSILNEVKTQNPDLKNKDFKLFISKHNSANALSLLNGYIIMNMGLFKYLNNEAQFAAVVCHEIAHQELDHLQKNILYKAKQKKEGVYKKEAKEIKKKKYNQYDKAFDAIKKHLFTNSKRHRKLEEQADSLGFELFKKTKYPKHEFLEALKVFAELDSLPEISIDKNSYKKYFDFPETPFKKEWLKMEDFKQYNYDHYKEKIDKDSISSHPEMTERIVLLEKQHEISTKISENNIKTYDNSKFIKLQKIARNEDISNLYYLEQYGLSVYLTLYKMERYGKNAYYTKVLANNFNALYKAKKSYKLNSHVDQINPNEQDESYQQFLTFIWNLDLNDLKAISSFYSNIKS